MHSVYAVNLDLKYISTLPIQNIVCGQLAWRGVAIIKKIEKTKVYLTLQVPTICCYLIAVLKSIVEDAKHF